MPKTKPLEITMKRRRIMACINSRKTLDGFGDEEMAQKAGVSPWTFSQRKKRPEEFSIQELWNMGIKVYLSDGEPKLPREDVWDIS